jgi:sugar/nucleoside kinase (ribokinase family)
LVLVTCAGILVADICAADLPRISDPGELTFAPKGIDMYVGGHSANVSINLRKIGLREDEVSSVGAIGKDLFGDFVESTLRKHGVVTHLQRVSGIGTSKDLILVVRGEDHRYHVDLGANLHLDPDNVRAVLLEEMPIIAYIGGAGMLGKFDERLADILQTSRAHNCINFVDPVVPYSGKWDSLIRACEWVDIFHCNNVEASSMTGHEDPRRAADALIRHGIGLVIISMGERGLIAKSRRVTLQMPALKVPIADPSGAGDAFCSGVIFGLVKKTRSGPREVGGLSSKVLCDVLLEGTAAGAACVTAVGTTTAVSRENVDRLLKEQGSQILQSTTVTEQ